ncbi:multisubunit potassium/proton antiporter, PhaA subunit (TC 2.A.63.1.1)/multisubunit potassium/proton antiporter, PhaB subunit (TC 2.A.63.1.1) [Paracoccus aminovorans]|uniref:Multisubunit potassium/proton antiporter, PhaA subunit (TC 2.A.63.1.1)/multisubunit potassium/proton antiporter, PhaB subunit (TC 2.A.63.1.1) n=1 Tax=Paracoccus aminovorans TaxID=34004 RepID=A0A1I2ZBT9_9RHOB|nr:monovalent cation/H+ antiporter subunit A [Paracoccus aminovorans]CQR86323.1 multicomponent K+:H+ antiporter, subunit A [Paracoccus aminovorans]SFH35297.1 multisubunit potassium/proton antiporter, PhaA subunit (TC 2.A.63.1.1)/multisubunit potassium/proton antiporter, PhaB subunit (TC 2.A.63.1.1) [Paracoccus aminovorans]
MVEQNLLLLLVLTPFVSAALAATMPIGARNAEAWIAGLTMIVALVILAVLYPAVTDGGIITGTFRWVSSIGLDLTFRIDGFSWLFMVLVAGIGFLVILYARYYMAPEDPVPRLYSCLLAFSGAMSGLLLSGNIIMLVVFWELTSLVSFLLIGYWFQRQDARDGARMALIVTASGGLGLMVAMILIGQIAGSYDLDRVLAAGPLITSHRLYPVILLLFLFGAFTKSAQFPFHFWLPNAMAAPTPVSSYLHSATMVKAGVFVLLRFHPALGGTQEWFQLVTGVGLTTLLLAAVVALFRHDLKGLLAYSTISHLGLITTLAGIGSPFALVAAVFHIVNHAVFKASLFMAAGIIDHETGTRDMRRLSGLARAMPVTATLAIIASAAMAGVPLLNGFLSKEMFFEALYVWNNGSPLDNLAPYVAVVAAAFSAAYSLRFIVTVFFGPPATDLPHEPHEPPLLMRLPVAVLVAICLAVGILPQQVLGPWLQTASLAVVGPDMPHFSLKVWHGVTPALLMSLIAMGLGALLYLLPRRLIDSGEDGTRLMRRLDFGRGFDWLLQLFTLRVPRLALRVLSASGLQTQLRAMVLLGLAASWFAVGRLDWNVPMPRIGASELVFALLWLVGGACALGAAWQAKYHRFAALVLMGGAGLVTCATFVWLSAPDLAVTQLLVEIATTVLLLLGLRWLPKRDEEIAGDKNFAARSRRFRDFLIALACGTGMTALALAVLLTRPGASVGDWFLRNAYVEGGGTNVVNVILVDFRAFDTFGEITVLAIVGLTVYALLRRFRPAPESVERPRPQLDAEEQALEAYLFVPSVLMQWMFAPIIALSSYLFMRGHDLPGGGFAAGVTLAVGLLLQYVAANVRWVEARLTVLPVRWMGTGLMIAMAVGSGAWIFGYPFLSAHAQYIDVPVIGKVPFSTAMLFDLGVFSLVVGAIVLMLIAIAHQSLRVAPRQRPAETPADTPEETV